MMPRAILDLAAKLEDKQNLLHLLEVKQVPALDAQKYIKPQWKVTIKPKPVVRKLKSKEISSLQLEQKVVSENEEFKSS